MAKAKSNSSPGGLEIDVSLSSPQWAQALPGAEALSREAAIAAFQACRPGPGPMEVSIVLADDAFVRNLNRDYRDQDKPTNVLSFPALEEEAKTKPPADAPQLLGDVVVAYETTAAEARDQGKPLGDHLSHLVIHGMLHLLGHDHQTASQANEMEKLEIDVLAGLEIANPYADGSPAQTAIDQSR
ncbi:MAG: rRNA maturation RNase YbeY [Rhodospirillales bacterium]